MTQDQTMERTAPTSEPASGIASVAADLRGAAVQTFDATLAEVKSQAQEAKSNMAGEVKDVAMALRRASAELRGGSAQERTLGQIATTLADASDALRDKDLGEILHSIRKVARDNPLLFLGGAALLGFAASRFAKASAAGSAPASAKEPADQQGGAFAFVYNDPPDDRPRTDPSPSDQP